MNKHPLSGRKQSPDHIAKRVASVRKTTEAWSEEKRRNFSAKISAAMHSRSKELQEKFMYSHIGKPAWNKGKKCPQFSGKNHWNYGNKMSEEHKAKLLAVNLGKKQSAKTIVKRFAWSLNYHHSDETKAKIGMANGGINNGQWKGGISFEPYPTTWNFRLREAIRDRDGRKCRACGVLENGKRHHVHHVDYCKENILPDNLVSLCNSCHGKTNSNHSQWQEFFTQQNQTPLTGTNN